MKDERRRMSRQDRHDSIDLLIADTLKDALGAARRTPQREAQKQAVAGASDAFTGIFRESLDDSPRGIARNILATMILHPRAMAVLEADPGMLSGWPSLRDEIDYLRWKHSISFREELAGDPMYLTSMLIEEARLTPNQKEKVEQRIRQGIEAVC